MVSKVRARFLACLIERIVVLFSETGSPEEGSACGGWEQIVISIWATRNLNCLWYTPGDVKQATEYICLGLREARAETTYLE